MRQTTMVTGAAAIAGLVRSLARFANARAPLGWIADPEEIASVGCFLASDEARYMTGEMVIVNGGAHFG